MGQPNTPARGTGILERMKELGLDQDPTFAAEVIVDFISDGQTQLTELCAAIEKADATACERTAHRLKGASQNLGATEIAERAMGLEELGRSGNLEGATPMLESLSAEFGEITGFLRDYVRKIQLA